MLNFHALLTAAGAVVPVEERMLKEAFGDTYTRYT